jgi:hypothetical protein
VGGQKSRQLIKAEDAARPAGGSVSLLDVLS